MKPGTLLRNFVALFVDFSPPEVRPRQQGASEEDERLNRIALSTWLVLLTGIVILFGFHDRAVELFVTKIFGANHMSSFESWELGALVWNALFAIYFYLKVPPTDKLLVEKTTPIVVLLGVGGLTWLALRTLLLENERDAARHVIYVLAIGILFLVIDGVHAFVQKSQRHRREFAQCFLLADLPMVPALAVLAYYQAYYQRINPTPHNEQIGVFLSGAISFQLLASTLIFACIQAGVFRQAFGWVGVREPKAAAEVAR